MSRTDSTETDIREGAPYKYGVTQESKSFKEAPEAVLQAVNILTWAGEKAHVDGPEEFRKEPYLDFNECLSIGYLPGGSIGVSFSGRIGPSS
jgi:hypothetical protein